MVREITLTQGKVALVDDEDYERVMAFTWSADQKPSGSWYAQAWHPGQKRKVYLHNIVLGYRDGMEVDHRDRDTMNCTRANLRFATHAQNTRNRRLSSNNTSGYRGVAFNKRRGKWMAYVEVDGKRHYLGADFLTAESASDARDRAARQMHGEFAALNSEGS